MPHRRPLLRPASPDYRLAANRGACFYEEKASLYLCRAGDTSISCSLPFSSSTCRDKEDANDMGQYKGVIKWFNNAKGYGFVGREDAPDLFVHYSSIRQDGYKSLREGDEIEFDVVQGTKGLQADQVVIV